MRVDAAAPRRAARRRGRRRRTSSPRGAAASGAAGRRRPGSSLLFSLVLEPQVAPERLPELTPLAGRAVADAVNALTGLATTVKAPNDVLVERPEARGDPRRGGGGPGRPGHRRQPAAAAGGAARAPGVPGDLARARGRRGRPRRPCSRRSSRGSSRPTTPGGDVAQPARRRRLLFPAGSYATALSVLAAAGRTTTPGPVFRTTVRTPSATTATSAASLSRIRSARRAATGAGASAASCPQRRRSPASSARSRR